MSILLVLTTGTGEVKFFPLSARLTLGGGEPGATTPPGFEGTTVDLDPTGEGLKLEITGSATVLVNDRPPEQFEILGTGDVITLGGACASLVPMPDVEVVDDPSALTRVSGAARGAGDRPVSRSLLRGICGILATRPSEDLSADSLLDLALEARDANRAAFVVPGPDGALLPLAVRPEIDDAASPQPLVLSAKMFAEALSDGTPFLARRGDAPGSSLLVVPVVGHLAPSGAICLEVSRPAEDVDSSDIEDLAALGLTVGLSLERHRSDLTRDETERLTTIGRTMAGVAHDIKNLITGMRTGAYFLDAPLSSHETTQIRDAWTLLKTSQHSVEKLVTDMVEFGRPLTLTRTHADPEPTVVRAVDLSRARAEVKGVELVLDLSPVPNAHIDEAALERCLVNLVINAIDASPAGTGRVVVRLSAEGEAALIEIEDNGPGVPARDRARVFDLHFSTKGARGSGFGLAIARSVVEAHDGTISLEGRDESGAIFVIRLPPAAR
jgi:signal transduction histidine kinase